MITGCTTIDREEWSIEYPCQFCGKMIVRCYCGPDTSRGCFLHDGYLCEGFKAKYREYYKTDMIGITTEKFNANLMGDLMEREYHKNMVHGWFEKEED